MIERDKLVSCRQTALDYLHAHDDNHTGELVRALVTVIDAYLNQCDEIDALRADAELGKLVQK